MTTAKSGHMVADYLVRHAAEAQYLSISSLARECKVAEATVFRFCRALGFEGYHEMRIALAQANAIIAKRSVFFYWALFAFPGNFIPG